MKREATNMGSKIIHTCDYNLCGREVQDNEGFDVVIITVHPKCFVSGIDIRKGNGINRREYFAMVAKARESRGEVHEMDELQDTDGNGEVEIEKRLIICGIECLHRLINGKIEELK